MLLDLTNKDVRDHIVEAMANVFSSANISYVKWDMNRIMSDRYSQTLPSDRQGEFGHRYVLGLYDIMGRITKRFPEILFEDVLPVATDLISAYCAICRRYGRVMTRMPGRGLRYRRVTAMATLCR